MFSLLFMFLPLATKLGQGNIFRSVCQEFCPRGGSTWAGTPPLGRYTPRQVHHPDRYTPQAGTPPRQVHPLAGTPPGRYTLWAVHPPAGIPQQVHPPGQVHLPWAGTPPGRYTLWAVHPQAGIPRQGHPPGQVPPGQVPPGQVPPRAGTPPSTVHAGRYGQQAGGTHPTGMQSCYIFAMYISFELLAFHILFAS